jgi:hypothetical protein
MNYILTESQLKVIVENQTQLKYIKRLLPMKFAEVVHFMKTTKHYRYRKLGRIEFTAKFFHVLMNTLHPYLVGRYNMDWDYDLFANMIREAYLDDVVKLWDEIHEEEEY